MPTAQATVDAPISSCEDILCEVCHCVGEGCDRQVCHGLDAD